MAQTSTDILIRKIAIGLILCMLGGCLFFFARSSGKNAAKQPMCERGDAWLAAQNAVEAVLKNPDEADFHHPTQWTVENDPKVKGQYLVTGQVTATNSFNAKLKQTFTAVVRCEKGTWYTGRVTMD